MVVIVGAYCKHVLPVASRADVGSRFEVFQAKSLYDLDDDSTVAADVADRHWVLQGGTRLLPARFLVCDEARIFVWMRLNRSW